MQGKLGKPEQKIKLTEIVYKELNPDPELDPDPNPASLSLCIV